MGERVRKVNIFWLLSIQCFLPKFIVFFILLIPASPALNIGITVHYNMLYFILENTPKIAKRRDQGKQNHSPPHHHHHNKRRIHLLHLSSSGAHAGIRNRHSRRSLLGCKLPSLSRSGSRPVSNLLWVILVGLGLWLENWTLWFSILSFLCWFLFVFFPRSSGFVFLLLGLHTIAGFQLNVRHPHWNNLVLQEEIGRYLRFGWYISFQFLVSKQWLFLFMVLLDFM